MASPRAQNPGDEPVDFRRCHQHAAQFDYLSIESIRQLLCGNFLKVDPTVGFSQQSG